MLSHLSAVGATALGATVLTEDEELYVRWQREDGTVEDVPFRTFEQRSDTPSLDALGLPSVDEIDREAVSPPCCPDAFDYPGLCVDC